MLVIALVMPCSTHHSRKKSSPQPRSPVVAVEDYERTALTESIKSWSFPFRASLQCAIITTFVCLTWCLAFQGRKIGANLAATCTIAVASLLIPDMLKFAAIGVYAGMTDMSDPLLLICVSVLSCIAGLCFEYFRLFAGKGGRLGLSSFIGTTLTLTLMSFINPDMVTRAVFYDPTFSSYHHLDAYLVVCILISNLLGVAVTLVCRWLRPILSPLAAGNAASMISIIILESFFCDILPARIRKESAGSILQGAFVGMTSFDILSNHVSMFISGVLSGCMTLLLFPLFPHGVGGKRGFMAFSALQLFLLLSASHQIVYVAVLSQEVEVEVEVETTDMKNAKGKEEKGEENENETKIGNSSADIEIV